MSRGAWWTLLVSMVLTVVLTGCASAPQRYGVGKLASGAHLATVEVYDSALVPCGDEPKGACAVGGFSHDRGRLVSTCAVRTTTRFLGHPYVWAHELCHCMVMAQDLDPFLCHKDDGGKLR